MDINIDYSQYEDQQLINALAQVDDEQHPEQAMTIYQILLDRHQWHHATVDAQRLGYHNGWLLEMFHLGFLRFPVLSGFLDELYFENHAMDEKVQRLNQRLDHQYKTTENLTKCK